MSIWMVGDCHGSFSHVLEAVGQIAPSRISTLVFLGDLDCSQALEHELSEIRCYVEDDVWFIPGNHDTDSNQAWNALAASCWSDNNLHGKVKRVGGWQVAGLGGVFRSSIWAPPAEAKFDSYKAFRKDLISRRPPREWGLSETTAERRHLSTIFPDTVQQLGKQRAQVLVAHEAPSCHEFGWPIIDDLAKRMGVSYVFHGHHHETKIYPYCGFQAIAVGYKAIVELDGNGVITVVRPGDYDNEGGLNERGEDEDE